MERRVLLVSPSRGWAADKPQRPKFQTHPLGLLYLAGVLTKNGYAVKICDAYSFGYDRTYLREEIRRFRPHIMGLTAMTILAPDAYAAAQEAKNITPSLTTIMGGPHATALPQEALMNGAIDIVVFGEGEYTMLKVCDALSQGKSVETIEGIAYKENGQMIRTSSPPLVEDIDAFPFPAYELLDLMHEYNPPPHWGKKGQFASVVSSRGCPYGCIFCSVTRTWGQKYRCRSISNVGEELEMLYQDYGSRYITFRDSTLTLNKMHIVELCRFIIKNKLELHWNCNAHVNEVDKEMLRWMKQAGCELIQYGIECGNEVLLKKFKKVDRQRVKDALLLTQRVGIKAHGYFMFGLPGETKETARETIEFAKSLPLYSAGFTTATPFPGSNLWEYAVRNELILTTDWSEYNLKGRSVVLYEHLKADEILSMQKQAFREFYLRPKIFFHHISKINDFNNFINYLNQARINLK